MDGVGESAYSLATGELELILKPRQALETKIKENAVSTTRQEERLRDQCLLEAKLFRAIPIALAAGLATHSAIKLGYLMRHPSLGSLPKVFAAAVSGYWIGIFSYENKYNRRIYALRYSRYHDDKMVQKKLKDEMFDRYDSTYNIPFPIVDSEYRQSTSLNLDTERPAHLQSLQLDDILRPISTDLPVESVTDNSNTASRKQFGNTYAQLRLQNRMKYYANMYQGPYDSGPNTTTMIDDEGSFSLPLYEPNDQEPDVRSKSS